MTDLTFLKDKPVFDTVSILTLDALAPLSMVASMPGKYYRSQPAPTPEMLFGLLENALGWHFAAPRPSIIKSLQKNHGGKAGSSGVGFQSILQFHVRFGISQLPAVLHFEDYWSQHQSGPSFVGGSRDYDARAIPLMDAFASGQITVSDRSAASKDPAMLTDFKNGDAIHLNVLRPYFPQYYISPTPREYVLPSGPYMYRVETSRPIAEMLASAIDNPEAPLYLGSNDGWVDATWRILE